MNRSLPLFFCALLSSACGPANQGDHEALAACGSEACNPGQAARVEGESPYSMSGMPCIVTAMRDRQTGVYRVTLDNTYTTGYDTTEHTLFVTPSGEVELATVTISAPDNEEKVTYQPTQRCTLKAVSYFEDCLTAVTEGSNPGPNQTPTAAAFACVYPDVLKPDLPWFEGCEEQSPTCE